MDDLARHAVKLRAQTIIKDNRQGSPEERTALILAAQTLEVIAEVHHLRDSMKVTDEMVERAARTLAERLYLQDLWDDDPAEINHDAFRGEARAALEAALGYYE